MNRNTHHPRSRAAATLVVATVLMLFAACGSRSSSETAQPISPISTPTSPPPSSTPVAPQQPTPASTTTGQVSPTATGLDTHAVDAIGTVVSGEFVFPEATPRPFVFPSQPPPELNLRGIEYGIVEPSPTATPQLTVVPEVLPTSAPTPRPTPTHTPPPESTTCDVWLLVPDDVLAFAHDSTSIDPGGVEFLKVLATTWSEATRIEVVGHASSDGDSAYNLALSRGRADEVARILRPLLKPNTQLTTLGVGESDPIGDNSSAAGRAQNRRVEFWAEVPSAACDGVASS